MNEYIDNSTTAPPSKPDKYSLPFQKSEDSFRRYESYIAAAVKEYPASVTINPAPLRPSTFAARIRDAMSSLSVYRWDTNIDITIFLNLYTKRNLTVTYTDSMVTIGPRVRHLARVGSQVNRPSHTGNAIIFAIDKWTTLDLTSACRLLSSRLIVGPVKVFPQLNQPTCDDLCQNYDISIDNTQDPSFTLIF